MICQRCRKNPTETTLCDQCIDNSSTGYMGGSGATEPTHDHSPSGLGKPRPTTYNFTIEVKRIEKALGIKAAGTLYPALREAYHAGIMRLEPIPFDWKDYTAS